MGISIVNLARHYGAVRAIDGVSFDIADGEFVSLLGPSGCGKTTTLRCIAGLEDPTMGSIALDGRIVSAPAKGLLVPTHERQVGMVFQSYAVWPHMTVRENVAFPLTIRGADKAKIEHEVREALGRVSMGHLADRHPSQLSGGQQQRVALARAIVGNPRVLLFDEPLSNLDAKLREEMRGEIRQLQRRLGIAAVYVTHDREEALSMSDRVIVMNAGKIAQIGSPKELYHRPINRFVADFVGKVGFLQLQRQGDAWVIADGTTILTQGEGAGSSAALAAIRPENIRLALATETQVSKTQLRGRISQAHYLGPYTEYHLEIAGDTLRCYAQEDFDIGSEVIATIAPDDIVLLSD
ncbi:MAG: ABC transporter ATP-binding protein [Roseomonas sp.]|nr:ABC transporter ATP-binding protein [Roseomonas sp.]